MKILTVADRLDALGGLERAQLQACRELRDRGHRVDLLYTRPGELLEAWESVAARRVQVAGYSLYRRNPLQTARAVLGLIAAVRRLAPDVVYFHHHQHAFGLALTGKPLVCHLHLPPPPTRSRQDDFGLRRVERFVSVSQFTAEQWIAHLGAPRDRFTVVPNGVDATRFAPAEEVERHAVRASLGLPEDRFLVLYAARIADGKGLDCALEAMRLLPRSEYHLAIAGEPNPADFGGDALAGEAYERELRTQYADVCATWLGRIKEMPRLIASADAVVLPSRFPDPMPLLVLETLASGTPIVASEVGGIPEMLTGALSDSLVAPGDAGALAERVQSLMNWRTDRPQLGARGRTRVERDYTLVRMGDGVAAAIEQATSGGAP
jgi:glycosyltransferase involved in cell wall biosynthesis